MAFGADHSPRHMRLNLPHNRNHGRSNYSAQTAKHGQIRKLQRRGIQPDVPPSGASLLAGDRRCRTPSPTTEVQRGQLASLKPRNDTGATRQLCIHDCFSLHGTLPKGHGSGVRTCAWSVRQREQLRYHLVNLSYHGDVTACPSASIEATHFWQPDRTCCR